MWVITTFLSPLLPGNFNGFSGNGDEVSDGLPDGSTDELTGFYQQLKSVWSCSHMNYCLQNILHINLHILYIIQVKTNSKIQES